MLLKLKEIEILLQIFRTVDNITYDDGDDDGNLYNNLGYNDLIE